MSAGGDAVATPTGGAFDWHFGFANAAGKWLTAEKFGHKVNASGVSLKGKQVWTLEHAAAAAGSGDEVFLKSWLGRYLCSDKYGNLTCDSDGQRDDGRFRVEYSDDGRWAFRSVLHGMYLAGEEDQIHCHARAPVWWFIQLAMHPLVNMFNSNRRRYCHLKGDEVHGNELIPWGPNALLTLDYIDFKYAIKTSDGRYVHPDGGLQPTADAEALYTVQLRSGGLAFRASDGRYLTNVGSTAQLKARNKTITKDELFVIRASDPQCVFYGHNGKKVSIKQGVDLSSNQDAEEISEKEIFQIEYHSASKLWRLRTGNGKCWSLENANGIQAVGDGSSRNSLFEIEFLENGMAAFKGSNGKYVTIKMTGALQATSETRTDKEKFRMVLVNRPVAILRGEFGFVGLRNNKLDCAKPTYDSFQMAQTSTGAYTFKGSNGKYWAFSGSNAITCSSDEGDAVGFQLLFLGDSKVALKAPNGMYLKSENNGAFSASGKDVKSDTSYEF